MTIQLFDKSLNDYAESMTTPESGLLNDLNQYTLESVAMPIMLSGHLQGRVLSMISRLKQPSRILEIGTYTGYSALCLAEGLTSQGLLYTIDKNQDLELQTRNYLQNSGFGEQIIYITGDAKEEIPKLKETWDLVFIDADKRGYSQYFDMIIDNLSVGGFIIADNVLYNGEVLLAPSERHKNAQAIHEFNQKIQSDDRVVQVLLPIRDGLLVIEKVK